MHKFSTASPKALGLTVLRSVGLFSASFHRYGAVCGKRDGVEFAKQRRRDVSDIVETEKVRAEQAKGEPIHYVDATQEVALDHAGMKEARVLVVAITDPGATRTITELARRMNPIRSGNQGFV